LSVSILSITFLSTEYLKEDNHTKVGKGKMESASYIVPSIKSGGVKTYTKNEARNRRVTDFSFE